MAPSTPIRLSIVIPTLNEAERLPGLLQDLRALTLRHEIVVADGGSTDATVTLAERHGCAVLRSEPGRGRQLRAGIAATSAPWLLVVHADVRLKPASLREAEALVTQGPEDRFGSWPLRLDGPGLWLRLVEAGAALRWRLFGLAYGDQGLVLSRAIHDRAGGYPEWAIMEDVALSRALHRTGREVRFRSPIVADARRYLREGRIRRSVTNVLLILLFAAGVSPERLSRWYRPEPIGP